MSLKNLENKWKPALFSILEHLKESEFHKLLFSLTKIPHGVKSGKTRGELTEIIIQYFGPEGSISVMDKEMKQIPRMDADVQDLLRPFVEKLKKQKKNKGTTSKSDSVAKRQKAADGTSSKSAKRQKPEADRQKSCQPAVVDAAGPAKPKQKKKKTDLSATAAASCRNSEVDAAGPAKPKQRKKKTDLSVTAAASCRNSEVDAAGPAKPKQKKKKTDLSATAAASCRNSEGPGAAVHPGAAEEANRNIFMIRQPKLVPSVHYNDEFWPHYWS